MYRMGSFLAALFFYASPLQAHASAGSSTPVSAGSGSNSSMQRAETEALAAARRPASAASVSSVEAKQLEVTPPTPHTVDASAAPTDAIAKHSGTVASGALPSANTQQPTEAFAKPTVTSSQPAVDKPVDWFARLVAVVGVLLALCNFGFTLFKMKRDRRLSIEDDFWFRKILTPAAIEPLMEAVADLAAEVPDAASSADTQRAFAVKVTSEFSKLYSAVHALGLFDQNLPSLCQESLQRSEDVLTEYTGKLAQGQPTESAAEVRNALWQGLRETLEIIKSKHLGS